MGLKILVVSHDASRTGAPIGLLHFLKWLRAETNVKFSTILRDIGPLENEFRKLGPTYLFCPPKYFSGNFFKRLQYRIYLIALFKKLKKEKFDIIYCNTMVNSNVLLFLKTLDIKVVTHVREMESTIEHFGGKSQMAIIDQMSSKLICVGYNVRDELSRKYNILTDKIEVIHEYIDTTIHIDSAATRANCRAQLGIKENDFVVGACGGTDWRKGYDYFLSVAAYYFENSSDSNSVFLWVGRIHDQERQRIDFDIARYGLRDKIIFMGATERPLEFMTAMDVFFLTSREEPGGLVSLEAALFEKPVIVCEGTGGVTEFVENDAGIIIPYLSIRFAFEAISRLINDKGIRARLGEGARSKVLQKHNMHYASRKILKILERVATA